MKLLFLDRVLGIVIPYLRPEFFESPPLRWAFTLVMQYRAKYGQSPTFTVLKEELLTLDAKLRPMYEQFVFHLEQLAVPDEEYVKDRILEWVKRNVFVMGFASARDAYNGGDFEAAVDLVEQFMMQIHRTQFSAVDRSWFFDELGQRESRRNEVNFGKETYGTGMPQLDQMMHGGVSKGECALWLAYWKKGKSTMLMNHGAVAVRAHYANVLHLIFEGSRQQLEDRYDTYFFEEVYTTVKSGKTTPQAYKKAWEEYQHFKRKLVIRAYTDSWDHSILDVEAELNDLRMGHGWKPDMIIIDYLDLLRGRNGPYSQKWEGQVDACRDCKTLANRGYAVWSASQANIELKTYEMKEHIINANQVAGGKEKIRIVDFAGSLNSTMEEQSKGMLRVAPLVYRDNASGKPFTVGVDAPRMRFGLPIESPSNGVTAPGQQQAPTLGYK